MSRPRFVAIHGHIYQPPRENPWLERIEVQDSAAWCHDWNARVAAECCAPVGPTAASVADALALLGLGTELGAPPDLWAAQNAVARLWRESEGDREGLEPLMAALGFAPGALADPGSQG